MPQNTTQDLLNEANSTLLQPAKAEAVYQVKFERLQALLTEREALKTERTALTNAKFELEAEYKGYSIMHDSVEPKLKQTYLKAMASLGKKRSMVEASLQAKETKQSILNDKIFVARTEMRKQEELWWSSCLRQTLKENLSESVYQTLIGRAQARQDSLMKELGF